MVLDPSPPPLTQSLCGTAPVCVYIYVYTHVCVLIRIHTCVCTSTYTHTHKCSIDTWARKYAVLLLHTHIYIYIYICTQMCTQIYIYARRHMYMHTDVYIHARCALKYIYNTCTLCTIYLYAHWVFIYIYMHTDVDYHDRSLLQNIIFFIGLFCKRDLEFYAHRYRLQLHVLTKYTDHSCGGLSICIYTVRVDIYSAKEPYERDDILHTRIYTCVLHVHMGWLRLVGSLQ